MGIGRPTDCTPEVTAAVVEGLNAGLSITSACAGADISAASYHLWRSRASEGPPFSEFFDATTRARAKGVRALEAVVRKASQDDWRAAAWMLERRAPDEFSKRTQITGGDGGPVQVHDVTAAIDAELARRSAADLGIPVEVLGADGDG